MNDLSKKIEKARELSWKRFGKSVIFYLPGMFHYNGINGKYPAISITGNQCALHCDHCRGKILESMIHTATPAHLLEVCMKLAEKGNKGVLISGGCDANGQLPWDAFIAAIGEIKKRTRLHISIHSGLIHRETALRLKQAGVDQALIDVIGDDTTYRAIYHVPFGVSRILSSLEALQHAGLSIIPHIVCGLDYGLMGGEKIAVEMISRFDVKQMVIVSLMNIPGTPIWKSPPPSAEVVADVIAEARLRLPDTLISLGCARQRGNTRLEILALDAGVNRMALPAEEVIKKAKSYGLNIRYQRTCCSVWEDFSDETW
ncbi:MAG: radical SAM protein [Deltaproteobacteria bacterium]|nr:radical SAM protein [Deltaproteobacteria bacterium]MBW1962553.1 radical SAM protein [Deltaproteobacteria bacterium]MBW2153040.1 radical SAM protein [Deltaproteobacteria bacterium]